MGEVMDGLGSGRNLWFWFDPREEPDISAPLYMAPYTPPYIYCKERAETRLPKGSALLTRLRTFFEANLLGFEDAFLPALAPLPGTTPGTLRLETPSLRLWNRASIGTLVCTKRVSPAQPPDRFAPISDALHGGHRCIQGAASFQVWNLTGPAFSKTRRGE